jgi:hypothetical protein
VVKATGCTVDTALDEPRIAHPFDVAKADAMVEMRGLEPLTPSLQRRCSPS